MGSKLKSSYLMSANTNGTAATNGKCSKSEDSIIGKLVKSVSGKKDTKKYDEILIKPLDYLMERPDPLTPVFVKGLDYWLKLPADKLKITEEIIVKLAECWFMLDDIQDNAEIRRGHPPCHKVFGVPLTVTSIGYIFFKLQDLLLQLNHPEAIKIYTEESLNIHQGQGVEIYWSENGICPTENEFFQITSMRSVVCFSFIVRLMQLFSDNKEDFTHLTVLLGFYNQFRNDFKDLFMPEDYYLENVSSKFADDISEGKFSFPIVHAIAVMKNDEVYEILRQKPKDVDTKKRCVSIMREIGTKDYCKSTLEELVQEIKVEFKRIGPNPFFALLLEKTLDWRSA